MMSGVVKWRPTIHRHLSAPTPKPDSPTLHSPVEAISYMYTTALQHHHRQNHYLPTIQWKVSIIKINISNSS